MLDQTGLQNRQTSDVKYVPAGTGSAYCGPGDCLTFLITGAETGGAFFMAGVAVAPGGGAPPDVHSREDESLYLQGGTLTFQIDDKELRASAGDFIYIPRGTAHAFKNAGVETATLVMVCTPAGIEEFFAEAFILAADIADIPQIAETVIGRAMRAAPKYGVELLLPAADLGARRRTQNLPNRRYSQLTGAQPGHQSPARAPSMSPSHRDDQFPDTTSPPALPLRVASRNKSPERETGMAGTNSR